jgi:hypothetical protein
MFGKAPIPNHEHEMIREMPPPRYSLAGWHASCIISWPKGHRHKETMTGMNSG